MSQTKIIYRFQYNYGNLSMLMHDDKEYVKRCAKVLENNKRLYPVAIWTIYQKPKKEEA